MRLLLLSLLLPWSSLALEMYDCPAETDRDFAFLRNDRCARIERIDVRQRDVKTYTFIIEEGCWLEMQDQALPKYVVATCSIEY